MTRKNPQGKIEKNYQMELMFSLLYCFFFCSGGGRQESKKNPWEKFSENHNLSADFVVNISIIDRLSVQDARR